MPIYSAFEYCYRDASNYKIWGAVLLEGAASPDQTEHIVSVLESGEFFIAEQVRIPVLYGEPWKLSGWPSSDDQVWHTFHKLREPSSEELSLPAVGTVDELVGRLAAVKTWNEKLSPHWDI